MGQSECPVWIGANNWQLDDGTTAYLPSDGSLAPFLVTDDADGNTENCVTLFGSADYNCKCSKVPPKHLLNQQTTPTT